jgi:hypothetical protein
VQNLQNAAGKSAGRLPVQSDLLFSLLPMPGRLRLRLQKKDERGRPKGLFLKILLKDGAK